MSQVAQDLIAAKALIEDPGKWTKGTFKLVDDLGTCYCAIGAVCEVTEVTGRAWRRGVPLSRILAREARAQKSLHAQLPGYPVFTSVPAFNDAETTTHKDVMDLFDRAIQATGEKND